MNWDWRSVYRAAATEAIDRYGAGGRSALYKGPPDSVPVLYVDIDGTVREGKDDALGRFVNTAADVRVFPEAVEMMLRWRSDIGGRVVGISNQGGIALGLATYDGVAEAMAETRAQAGGLIHTVSMCPHHPDAADPRQAWCWCRKPSPGAVVKAAERLRQMADLRGESYPPSLGLFVGDRAEDAACAKNAGLRFMPADKWRAAAR